MSDISDALKYHETLIDVDLKEVVHNLVGAIAVAPPQLMSTLAELRKSVFRFDTLAEELGVNATNALLSSSNDFIISDNRIVDAIGQNCTYFDDPTKLTAACAVIDTARIVTDNFTENVSKRYRQLKLTVMPNEVEINAQIAKLTNDLRESAIIDLESFLSGARALIEKIDEECDHIERNILTQKSEFGKDTDELAYDVEWTLHKSADRIYAQLPDSVNTPFFICGKLLPNY